MRLSIGLKIFLEGRQILDIVLVENEVVDERRRSGKLGLVFMIDFEKTYDHVNSDFLDHVLKKGFNSKLEVADSRMFIFYKFCHSSERGCQRLG